MSGAALAPAQMQMMRLLLLAGITVLLGAYGLEYIGGLAPCQLCYYQRIPYFAAIILGAAAWLRPEITHWIAAVLTLNFLISAGLGLHHAGVEWQWWAGPASCGVIGGDGATTEQLLAQILAAPVVRCDEIQWSLFGISLAGYNALISACLAAWSALIFLKGRKDQIHGRI